MSLSDHPQLVINTLVTLNNLTYYSTSSDAWDSSITARQEEIAQCKLHVHYMYGMQSLTCSTCTQLALQTLIKP